MRKLILSFVFFSAMFFANKTMLAQDDNNIMVVTTWYLSTPEDGSRSEFDSLSTLVYDNVISKKTPK